MLSELFNHPGELAWFSVAGVLLLIEIVRPTRYVGGLALAVANAGLLGLLAPRLPFSYQLFFFSFTLVGFLIVAHHLNQNKSSQKQDPLTLRRAEQYIGRIFKLEEPIVDGRGLLLADNAIWSVRGQDCCSGTQVKVVRTERQILVVNPLPA